MKTFSKLIPVFWAVLFISFFAQIEIELPFNEAGISISGQTFAILLVAVFLGHWYGALAVLVYIILGAAGLPVFSGGSAGLDKLWGGSAGYFIGFLLGAFVTGYLGDKGWRTSFCKCLLAMVIGTLIILICGTVRLFFLFEYNWTQAIENGFTPFLLGGGIKVVLGALVVYLTERFLYR